jgi:endo-1,3-1,4-beta-glycanase ExoK
VNAAGSSQGGVGQAGSSAVSGGPSAGAAGSPPGGAGAGTGGNADAAGQFVLDWQDDFNTFDAAAWELENFSYDGNEAQFTPGNASVGSGILTMKLTAAPSGSAKPYLGVEMRSRKTLTYGKLSARMRFAAGSGVVSGLVTFYTPFPNCDWNEIDIEHLGKSSNSSQLNSMVYLGAVNPNCSTSVTPTQDPLLVDLGLNAETAFHEYDIEWTPASVKYFVDGLLLRTWVQNISLLSRPQNILLTIWASSAADWAGPINAGSAPTSSQVDWIKVYKWNGQGL